jgi:hypothetical protein
MTIEERLERLERENKRLKYLLFSLLFLVAGVFFIGAMVVKKGKFIPDEVKAHKFVLFDGEGGKGQCYIRGRKACGRETLSWLSMIRKGRVR